MEIDLASLNWCDDFANSLLIRQSLAERIHAEIARLGVDEARRTPAGHNGLDIVIEYSGGGPEDFSNATSWCDTLPVPRPLCAAQKLKKPRGFNGIEWPVLFSTSDYAASDDGLRDFLVDLGLALAELSRRTGIAIGATVPGAFNDLHAEVLSDPDSYSILTDPSQAGRIMRDPSMGGLRPTWTQPAGVFLF